MINASPTQAEQRLPLNHIQPDARQVRKHFDPEALQQLAESIRAHGVLQPIIVEPSRPGEDGSDAVTPYTIIAGERRWRASAIAGMEDIPVIIRTGLQDDKRALIQVLENLQREDLTLHETATGVAALMRMMSLDEAAEQLGKSKPWVSKHARIGELPTEVQLLIRDGHITSLDIALDIAAIREYSVAEYNHCVNRICDSSDSREQIVPLTRAQLRAMLETLKAKAEQQAARKAEKAAAKDSKDSKHSAIQRASAKEKREAEKALEQRVKALRQSVEALEQELTMTMLRMAGQDIEKLDRYQVPLRAHCRAHYYPGMSPRSIPRVAEKAPAVFRANKCELDALLPVLNIIAPGSSVTVYLEVTQAQAKAIQDIIGEPLKVSTDHDGFTLGELQQRLGEAQARAQPPAAPTSIPLPQDTSAAVKSAAESIAKFLDERTVKDAESEIKSAVLFHAYRAWCDQTGTQGTSSTNAFGDVLALVGIEKRRANTGVHYRGLQLRA